MGIVIWEVVITGLSLLILVDVARYCWRRATGKIDRKGGRL